MGDQDFSHIVIPFDVSPCIIASFLYSCKKIPSRKAVSIHALVSFTIVLSDDLACKATRNAANMSLQFVGYPRYPNHDVAMDIRLFQ